MPTPQDVSSRIVQSLQATEPDLDTSIGSVVRKIIDAVAAPIAEMTADAHLINYQYDIDSKSGGALKDFVELFGMTRLTGNRSSGVVTFTRSATIAAKTSARIPIGTRVTTNALTKVTAHTLAAAVMDVGQASVDVPVQALLSGPKGNVAAGTLNVVGRNLPNITSVTNTSPLTGGQGAETDDQLRARFKATVFRNIAGTEQMFRALALQFTADPTDPTSRPVSQVNVLGPQKNWIEQLAVVSSTATSTITDAAFIYPNSIFVTDSNGVVLQPNSYAVTLNNTLSGGHPVATLTIASATGGLADGIYQLQFDYVPFYSRNDPFGTRWGSGINPINNRVDIWINGMLIRQASQTARFSAASTRRFNTTTNDPLNLSRWVLPNGSHPAANDVFVPLGFGPIVSVPDTITIDGTTTTFNRVTHYDLVHQNDAFGYSAASAFGLIWKMAGAYPTTSNPSFPIAYTYNALPAVLQGSIESQWRLVGTDVQVHAGVARYFKFYFAVVYDRRYSSTTVQNACSAALTAFVNQLGFNSALQVSDVLQVVHNVPGVDNVRLLTSADDGTNYAIQEYRADGTVLGVIADSGTGRAKDIYFDDAHYPVFQASVYVTKARNTFGVA